MTRTQPQHPDFSHVTPRAPAGAAPWLLALRRYAADCLRDQGWPTVEHERWRFTPTQDIAALPIEPGPPARADAAAAVRWAERRLGEDDTRRIVVVNGHPPALATDGAAPIEVRRLTDVLREAPGRLEPYLGQLAPTEQFAALNDALFDDGLVVWVRSDRCSDRPLHLVHVADPGADPAVAYTRVLVLAEPNSEARLIETYLYRDGARHLTNSVTEVVLAADARLEHCRVHEGTANGLHLGHLAVRQHRGTAYASHVVALGGDFYRLALDVELVGEGASCTLDGAYHVAGDDFVDHHTRITHASPRATSRERYRGLLDGRGRAVFDGIIQVCRDAQQSNAHQENHNLLLSDDARLHTKPHLEIDADDVKCSHGATTGTLDDAQLHYLRARGIGADQARAILTYAFARVILDDISHAPLRRRLGAAFKARIPHGSALEELA